MCISSYSGCLNLFLSLGDQNHCICSNVKVGSFMWLKPVVMMQSIQLNKLSWNCFILDFKRYQAAITVCLKINVKRTSLHGLNSHFPVYACLAASPVAKSDAPVKNKLFIINLIILLTYSDWVYHCFGQLWEAASMPASYRGYAKMIFSCYTQHNRGQQMTTCHPRSCPINICNM